MNSIDKKFSELKGKKEGAFIAYIVAGDPDYETSLEIADCLINSGVDILELGLPFSDPIADGPVIQKAGQRSLKAGMNTDRFFDFAKEVSRNHDIPLVCMTYYNLLLHRGLEKFARDCKDSGISGLIIPDLPIEESSPLLKACSKNNISLIPLVAPTTTDERMKAISKNAKGFIYTVSVRGITGERKQLSGEVAPLIKRIRKFNKDAPLAVGFGISNPEHVKSVMEAGADAAIVGSALVKIIDENLGDKEEMIRLLAKKVSLLKQATL